jgi:membrane-associated protease RseP (regulator of RpoE activity)
VKDPFEDVQITETRKQSFVVLAVIIGLLLLLFVTSPWVAAIIVGIIAMVMLHEAGHYLAARRAGMKATEFFLGFGPRLWSFRRGETEYGVKAIPAGGYVRIIGMSNLEEVAPEDEARTFRRGATANRLIVILAGVTVNALLALVLFTVAVAGDGRVVEGPSTTVTRIVKHSAAANADPPLEVGDRFVAVNGKPIAKWDDLKNAIESHGGKEVTFTVVRHGERVDVVATPQQQGGQGFLGVAPGTRARAVTLLGAIPEGFRAMGDVTVGTAKGIGHIFTPSGVEQYSKNFTSEAPKPGSKADQQRPRSLIGIVDEGSGLVAGDIWALFWMLGAISLVLALFNLIPLLPFDGGHAAVVIYESVASKIKGRTVRVDFRKLMPATAVVLALFLMLGLSAMALDIRDIAR